MGRADFLKRGDFNRICDRCGRKVKASHTAKQTDGWTVCIDGCFDKWDTLSHPQNRVRGVQDRQSVPNPRPEPPDQFVPILTWDDATKSYV